MLADRAGWDVEDGAVDGRENLAVGLKGSDANGFALEVSAAFEGGDGNGFTGAVAENFGGAFGGRKAAALAEAADRLEAERFELGPHFVEGDGGGWGNLFAWDEPFFDGSGKTARPRGTPADAEGFECPGEPGVRAIDGREFAIAEIAGVESVIACGHLFLRML